MTDANEGLLAEFSHARDRVATRCVCCGSSNLKSSPAVLMPFVAHRAFGWEPVTIDSSWGLGTIKTGNAYSICKSLQCSDCDFLFLDIRFSENELANLYGDYRGEAYNALRESYEPGYSARNTNLNAGINYIADIEKFLQPHLKHPLSILDWGGDTGKNTPFQNKNASFDIYDISDKETIAGARRVSKAVAQERKYQLVVCSNVLEHVPYPADLLLDMKQSMSDESVLYIEVPLENLILSNEKDLYLKKRHWHEHINFFTESSIRQLVKTTGLQVVNLDRIQATVGGKSYYIFQVACKLN